MQSYLTLLALALAASTASAHTIFQQIGINGAMQARHDFMRLPHYDGPIEDVTSSALACNGGPNPLLKISNNVAAVQAGDSITLQWGHTLDSDFNSGMIIDASHNGPVSVWMAKVSDALGPIPNSGWFKIYEDGLSNGQWAVAKLIANKGKFTVTIPKCIPNGDYLFRGELIALHAAGNYPGAQIYMTCAQLRLTGGGNTTPATVSLPGAYSGSDPGIKFNLYSGATSYTIPGPRPFTCGGDSGVVPPVTVPASSTVKATSTSTTSTTAAAAATTTAASTGTVAKYGQCGGIGYSGATGCVSGSKCVEVNAYYFQCQ